MITITFLALGIILVSVGIISAYLNQLSFWKYRSELSNEQASSGLLFPLLPVLAPKLKDPNAQRVAILRAKLFAICVPTGAMCIIFTLLFAGYI